MKTVKLGNVVVGEGIPKVLVPVVGRTAEEIVEKGRELAPLDLDVVEWRADFYEDALDTARLLDTLDRLSEALAGKPLLFTFRTAKEGGMQAVTPEGYEDMNLKVAATGKADLIDIELSAGAEPVHRCIDSIHRMGRPVIASSHEFRSTPSLEEIIFRLRKMQELDADILKIAVMPQSRADVLTLLSATEIMSREYADRPLVTMSMSPMGVISRLCGESFGSAMTFGAVGETSAPGQIPLADLKTALRILHAAV